MSEKPILFSTPMVRAIFSGAKTQTRRAVKGAPVEWSPTVGDYHPTKVDRHGEEYPGPKVFGASDAEFGLKCPYGKPGDELWVRETWGFRGTTWHGSGAPDEVIIEYLADGTRRSIEFPHDTIRSMKLPEQRRLRIDESQGDYREYLRQFWKQSRPSIFMPRWASRITLIVEDVRIERLQDISEEDAIAEGVGASPVLTPTESYRLLWESINGPGSWALNPWVWVISFKRIKP